MKQSKPTPYQELADYMSRRHPDTGWYISMAGFVVDRIASYQSGYDGSSSTYPGMVICFKPAGTRLRKRDGSWASGQIARQAPGLDEWIGKGYIAQFAVGMDEAATMIDSYLEYAV